MNIHDLIKESEMKNDMKIPRPKVSPPKSKVAKLQKVDKIKKLKG